MEIRPALDEDIPAIVGLLKISLGEDLMPKTERYWRWKHVDNPFGRSPVLLAVEDKQIVGVRAFMRWTWTGRDRVEAVRAVDTATHPSFQGKGIFSRLTLALLESSRQAGIDLVFNTPNDKSKPGYLKMGWLEAGKLPVALRVHRPLAMAEAVLLKRRREADFVTSRNQTVELLNHAGLQALLEGCSQVHSEYHTAHSPESLRWRYLHVPVAEYRANGIYSGNEIRGLFIYRLKPSRFGLEFRLADAFAQDHASRRELGAIVRKCAVQEKADYITQDALSAPVVNGPLSVKSRIGPVVTVRPIAAADINGFLHFANWMPSLGDLELF